MTFRQLVLAAAAVMILAIFFSIPVYHNWKINRLEDGFLANIDEDLDHLSLADRRLKRWGDDYQLSVFIKEKMKEIHADTNSLILVPPAEATRRHIGAAIPEPIVVYFYSGINTIGPENHGVDKAAYAVILKDQYMGIVKIDGPVMLKHVLEQYKTY